MKLDNIIFATITVLIIAVILFTAGCAERPPQPEIVPSQVTDYTEKQIQKKEVEEKEEITETEESVTEIEEEEETKKAETAEAEEPVEQVSEEDLKTEDEKEEVEILDQELKEEDSELNENSLNESDETEIFDDSIKLAATVTLSNRRVDNKILEIEVGDTVQWVNNEEGLIHVIFIKGIHKFQGELKKLYKGDTFEYTFEKEGEYVWQSSTNPLQQGRIFVGIEPE